MRREVGRRALLGEVTTVLAISEPFAGSDVARIRTTAVESADGRVYVVSSLVSVLCFEISTCSTYSYCYSQNFIWSCSSCEFCFIPSAVYLDVLVSMS